uniref:CSON012451 protein n=1 Tax=Culicoides sonorensis TaxID=179676 RepID=A0A336M9E8_CULSO
MIKCTDCQLWYHFKCVGLTRRSAEMSQGWKCQNCRFAFPRPNPTNTETANIANEQATPVNRHSAGTSPNNAPTTPINDNQQHLSEHTHQSHVNNKTVTNTGTIPKTITDQAVISSVPTNGAKSMISSNMNPIGTSSPKSASKMDNNIYASQQTTYDLNIELAVAVTEKVLGMFWNTKSDTFTYSLKYIENKADVLKCLRKPTKRELLSIQMSIYDPLGLIGHYLNYFKILLQSLWKTGLSWHDHINDEQLIQWEMWAKILPNIAEIEIPRCYLQSLENYDDTKIEIHIFVDAKDNWPADINKKIDPEYFVCTHQITDPVIQLSRFSSYNKLLHATGQVFRFCELIKQNNKNHSPFKLLNADHLLKAENYLISTAQKEIYADEYNCLIKNNNQLTSIDPTSKIYQMCPFIDENGILRSNGRLKNIKRVNADTKQPIILPRKHRLTELIVFEYHKRFHHQMNETVVNELRTRFHIPKIRQVVKVVCNNCSYCRNLRAKPVPPQMGPIPNARVQPYTRPFTFTGVDYFGPISVAIGRRQEKRWGVLFTCLTTRAIHIETASKLDTDVFILCFRDFMNRRGRPSDMYSDRGTNFIGAEKILKEELQQIDSAAIAKELISPQLKWHFNPPASPHMGGCWERLVRSVKKILYATLPTRTPSEQLLRSYLIEIENIINSRPLTYLPIDSEESEALTPNHFLRLSSSGNEPLGNFSDDIKVLKQNWMTSQQLANRFWKRWIREYLPELNRRTKWCKPSEPLKIGDIVIIVDENNPRNSWPKGKIVSVKTAADGQVRSCTVKTVTDHPCYPDKSVTCLILTFNSRKFNFTIIL